MSASSFFVSPPSSDRAVPEAGTLPGDLYAEGLALLRARRPEEALDRLGRALDLAPEDAALHAGFGLSLAALGQEEAAVSAWRTALALDPTEPHAAVNLANAERIQDRDTARARYLRVLARAPADAAALGNLGALEESVGRIDRADPLYRRALGLDPAQAVLWSNLGAARHASGALEAAGRDLDHAVALAPDLAEARWNRALNRLLRDDYAVGLADHEWRWRRRGLVPPAFDLPYWRGEPLAGRRLLVWCEQGHGDALQFVRLVPRIGDAEVTLVCRPELRRLFGTLAGGARIAAFGEKSTSDRRSADLQVPLMSLPLRLGLMSAEAMAAATAYLFADPLAARQMAAAAPDETGAPAAVAPLRIGLVWSGNPAHPNDRARSLPAEALGPLLDVPGLRFISLQRDGASMPGLAPMPDVVDFADTAALIAGVDLIIAVDTAVAHLAGALGKPVWILLAAVPDWRWGTGRGGEEGLGHDMVGEPTPWYGSARLFRQRHPGEWGEVIARVALALAGRRLRLMGS